MACGPRYKVTTWSCIVLLIFQSGCASSTALRPSSPVVPDREVAEIGTVGVATARFNPAIGLEDINSGKGTGALKGAGSGALKGASLFSGGGGGCSGGAACGAVALIQLLLMAAGATVGAIAGGISGAVEAEPAEKVEDIKARAQVAIAQLKIQENISDSVVNYAKEEAAIPVVQFADAGPASPEEQPDYQSMAGQKVNKVLEVAVLSIGTQGGGFLDADPYLSLVIRVRARLVSVKDSKALSVLEYAYVSRGYKVSEWGANNFQPLSGELALGYKEIAEEVVDEMFLLFYPEGTRPQVAKPVTEAEASQAFGNPEVPKEVTEGPKFPPYVLGAEYPEIQHCLFCAGPFASKPNKGVGNVEFVRINDLQPTLRWEAFPRPYDLNTSEAQHQITDVTYEIKIYSAVPAGIFLLPERQIYIRRGLPTPYHQLDQSLEPCAEYFWTVRARFKLDSRNRVTEWAGTYLPGADPWHLRRPRQGLGHYYLRNASSWMFYPFKTPAAEKDKNCPR